MQQYDLVIVGGGLAGASLACALADTPLRIAVVEAVPFDSAAQPSYDERTLALTWSSRRIFEGIGVWDSIAAREAEPILGIHISNRGHAGISRLDHRQAGTEALGYVVPTRVLGQALQEKLAASSRIELLCPAAVTAVTTSATGATVTIEQQGEEIAAGARLVAIADGGRSPVLAELGMKPEMRLYDQSVLLTIVSVDRDHHGIAYERFTEHGPLALLPLADRRYAVVWTLSQKEIEAHKAQPNDVFLADLQRTFGDRAGRFSRPGNRNIYPLALSHLKQPTGERLVVIGNAAHTVHPVAGQGFNLGLRDVAALAEVISDSDLQSTDIGSAIALERYAGWRRWDTFQVTTFTHGLIRIFSNEFPPLALARNLGLGGIDLLPPVKRFLLRRTMGMTGRQTRLGLGLPLRADTEANTT
ncbi:MAG: 2-octaprenyl-6-methoxyphenyl hydroxylase [Pseudomonadota bacterium]|nr:2-octaprenyl-6-methoxyphenyl hydroxylase [Pseudomonadota bacterium]